MSIKTDAVVIRDEITTGANTATRVGTNLVDIADDLVAKQAEIDLNSAKVGVTAQMVSDINTNNLKVGVTTEEANPDVVGQAEAEAGTATTERIWTAERVKQAIVALGGSGSVDDTAYGISWDGVTGIAPSKNALYDFIESQVFKVDALSNIIPIFWGGTQAQHDAYFNITDFPTGVPDNYFTVITDGVPPVTSAIDIVNAPNGNLVATDVQGALDELQTELDANISFDSTSSTRLADTSGTNTGDQVIPVTGVDFDPVGTDNSDDNAVNTLYSGLATSKQDTLVSATNIKTINGTTILGSGDLVVSGGGSAPVLYNDSLYGGFSGRYYTKRSSKDTSANTFYQTSATNLGSLYNITTPFSGQTIFTPSTVTNIKINYSALFAETYICYLIVKRIDGGGVETNTELWNSGNIVTTASNGGSIDVTGLSISLLANDRLFVSTIRTATTESVATGFSLSIALYE